MQSVTELLQGIVSGDRRSLARAITLVENELPGYEELLLQLPRKEQVPIIGITGPPGAGKSTLINALVKQLCASTNANGVPKQIAVVAIDPTSPFSHGSLLGDRLRMSEHFTNPQVFIRSLATRGALGGLSAKTLEVLDVMRAAPFDHVLVETVGVGQSEIEIVTMADTTIVVLVPEAGDEIQALKSGIMEIGDIFVVNKADREGADRFAAGLIKTLHERLLKDEWEIPVIKTIASGNEGIIPLIDAILSHQQQLPEEASIQLAAERCYRLIQQERMRGVTVKQLAEIIRQRRGNGDYHFYKMVKELAKGSVDRFIG